MLTSGEKARVRRAVLAVALLGLAGSAAALDVPYLTGRVVDLARLLDDASVRDLDETLHDYERQTGRQIVVLTLTSLEGEPLEEYSIKVARAWKLGRAGRNDGILVLVARDDRKARIEVGYGLEGPLTDASAGRIIRDVMVPPFRRNDYASGLKAGVAAVIGTLDGTYAPPPVGAGGREAAPVNPSIGEYGVAAGVLDKLTVSVFVFGVLGYFEYVGITLPGLGGLLYFFLIPLWASCGVVIWGPRFGGALLLGHLILFPILRKRLAGRGRANQYAPSSGSGGFYIGGSSWSSGDSGGISSGDSGGFSGGGGDFGGGGASGSW